MNNIHGKPVTMFHDGNAYFEEIMNQYEAANHKCSLDKFMQEADLTAFITNIHDETYGHRPVLDENKDGIF